MGITLGSFWAYYELGWGGWWFWDPVENASFMPWLMGAALLHSAIVTEKRGAFPAWTAFLGMGCFTLSMLGAFLVRSGVLTSVHAFAVDPARGVLLLGILGIAAGGGFVLFAWRAPKLRDPTAFAPVSRESALFVNNIILAAVTVTVVLGTLYPLIKEAISGDTVSVGPPFFNLTFVPLMAVAFVILPAGPMLAWKRGDAIAAVRRLIPAAVRASAAALAVYALVSPRKAFAAAAVGMGAWLVLGALDEAAGRIRLFQTSLAESGRRLTSQPRGAWGMTLAHLGLGVFVLGAAFETAWRVEAAEVLAPGAGQALGATYHLAHGSGPVPAKAPTTPSSAAPSASPTLRRQCPLRPGPAPSAAPTMPAARPPPRSPSARPCSTTSTSSSASRARPAAG